MAPQRSFRRLVLYRPYTATLALSFLGFSLSPLPTLRGWRKEQQLYIKTSKELSQREPTLYIIFLSLSLSLSLSPFHHAQATTTRRRFYDEFAFLLGC